MNRDRRINTFRVLCTWLIVFAQLILAPASWAAESITYYHWDALGSPVAATDEQGNLKWREQYAPYGERLQNETPAQTNTRWFTGHPHDNATGLTYMGARWYDPAVGRFYAVDPKDFNDAKLYSFNRYAYAANNPYKFVDPDGRDIAFAVDPNGAGGSGHTSLYFQNAQGHWFKYDQGARGYTSSGEGNLGFILGLDAPAGVSIEEVQGAPIDSVWLPTSPEQDARIAKSAVQSHERHNSGLRSYNLYSNNCTDAAVDVVDEAEVGLVVPNPWYTVRPNSWYRDLKEWRNNYRNDNIQEMQ